MLTFGPVPSRRLGRSLGINNIPPKVCSYSCVYCQVGRTTEMCCQRRGFYGPQQILSDVQAAVDKAHVRGEPIDYLTFVPDGEPTLDANLGDEIDALRSLRCKIAVITNASLLWRDDVRADLAKADWVSLKVDSVQDDIWRRISRPHGALQLPVVLRGMQTFAQAYGGELVTETMLVRGVNDAPEHVQAIGGFLAQLRPARAYLGIPTRPPAEAWVHAPDEETVNHCYQLVSAHVNRVEYLIGYEGDAFASTGDLEDDLLAITAVHPMRAEAVGALLERAGADWSVIRVLIAQGQLAETEFQGQMFYVRGFHTSKHE